MSDWVFTGSNSYVGITDAIDLPFNLTQQVILIDLDSTKKKRLGTKQGM